MLIKSITLENFLPFQKKQVVTFSTDSERNVTLIMGDNGAGKTSLAQAFEWCLYGRPPEGSTQVINKYVSDRIASGSERYVSVEISILKGDVNYTVERRQRYYRPSSGARVRFDDSILFIFYKDAGGETRQVPKNEELTTINSLLSSELSHYFFFDGEHVKNMRKELERGRSSDFADAVKTILGLQPIASARDHLKSQGNRRSVEKWFKAKYDHEGDQDYKNSQKRIESLNRKIEKAQNDYEDAKADEDIADEEVEKYQQLLRDNEESEEAQKAVDKASRQAEGARQILLEKKNDFFVTFQKGYYRFFVDRPVRDAQTELADEDKISKGVPNVNADTINYLLEQHECICGTKLDTGNDAFLTLTKLLEYVPPKDLGTYISEFDKECRVRTEDPTTFYADLSKSYADYFEAKDAVTAADKALDSAQDYLDSIMAVDVDTFKKGLANAKTDRSRAAGRERKALGEITAAEQEKKRLMDAIDTAAKKNEKNKEIIHCLDYVNYIYDYLDSFYESKERDTRRELEQRVNKFFSQMYEGQLRLKLDDNYGVDVLVEGINMEESNEDWRTSSGQTLAIILAFILGILDIAKENISQGENLLVGDTYPLVMDAPLSDFDKTRIGTICNLLPTVAEQVVIIIKDTDGDIAEEHLKSKIGQRYTIAKITDYESEVRRD